MTHTLVIAAREVRERSFILATAAVIAVLPFVATVLPSIRRYGAAEARGAVGGILAIAFAMGLAIALGASMVGRDLTDRRLSFYFSRPVNASAIWFGKLAGAIVLVALSFAIIYTPAVLSAGGVWRVSWSHSPGTIAAAVLAIGIFIVVIAHAISTIARSRSTLALFDVVAAGAVAGAYVMIARPLFEAFAMKVLEIIIWWFLAALLAALIGSGAWQLSRGRADVRRSHAEMSKFLWASLAAAVAIAGAYTLWVVSIDIKDISRAQGTQAPTGAWAVIAGESKGRLDYRGSFLVNTRDESSVRFAPWSIWSNAEFNRAGNAAIANLAPDKDLVLYRLDRDVEAVETGVPSDGQAVVSDDLNRIAVITDRTVSVHDVDGRRLLAAAPMRKRQNFTGAWAFFVSPDVLRIIEPDRISESERSLRILELDVRTRQLVETGRWATQGRYLHLRANGDGSTLLVRVGGVQGGGSAVLLDGRTASVRAVLPVGDLDFWSTRVLVDGRVVTLHPREGLMRILNADGALSRQVAIGEARRGRIITETAAGQLVLSLHPSDFQPGDAVAGWETFVIDLTTGTVVRRAMDISPAYRWWSTDPRAPEPNRTGELVVPDANGTLWLWNIRSGEKKKLV